MQLSVTLIASTFFSVAITADVLLPRQSGCAMCAQVMPTCPACPSGEECQVLAPLDCSECPKAQCAASSPDATPTISSPGTSVTTGTSEISTSVSTSVGSSTSTLVSTTSETSVGSSTGTTTASVSTSSSTASEARKNIADIFRVLEVAFGMVVPVLGLQLYW